MKYEGPAIKIYQDGECIIQTDEIKVELKSTILHIKDDLITVEKK